MRIVIDLQSVQTESRFRGIGRYSLSLALAMARNAGDHEIWLALSGTFPGSIPDIRHAFSGLIPPERIRIFDFPSPTAKQDRANAWRIHAAEKIREHFFQSLNPDVTHVSSLFEGFMDDAAVSVGTFVTGEKTAVTLYDLIPLLNQKQYLHTRKQRDYYFRKLQSLKNARLLLAISHYSRLEAIESLKFSEEFIVNISAAVDDRFHPVSLPEDQIRQLKTRYDIKRKMVMYAPGGFDIRKNFEGLIKAFALLPSELRADYQLVIVSKINDHLRLGFDQLRKKAGLAEDDLVLTGYVSDDDLVALYNIATLFVFPSKYEGFGLTLLEAMACGAPSIASNATSIPEVVGWDDALFDPASITDMAEKISRALIDEGFRRQLKDRGLKQSKQFSWTTSAKRAITAFESLHCAPPLDPKALNQKAGSYDLPRLLESLAHIKTSVRARDSDLISAARSIAFNTAGDIPRQLLLDISVIVHGDAKSGIQRVVRSIRSELLKKAPDGYRVRLIYFDEIRYRYATDFLSRFQGIEPVAGSIDEVTEFNQDDIYLALDLNAHLTRAVHALHLSLQRRGIHMYFIVYDLLLAQRPDWWPAGTSTIFQEWLESIAQVATGLVCISEAVAVEVREWLRLNSPTRLYGPTVSSFHLGADVENSMPSTGMPDDASVVLSTLKAKPSFVMVGTIEPRKGHSQTLEAFEWLWERGANLNLVIVGKEGWLVDNLVTKLRSHPELNNRLFWLEGISDEYLSAVYAACTCLIAPSEGEGFGLPLIEAAQLNLPIIARDIPVFREVAREHAFYFDGFSPEQLAKSIEEWISLNATGKAPTVSGMPWLTWEQSTGQLMSAVFEHIRIK